MVAKINTLHKIQSAYMLGITKCVFLFLKYETMQLKKQQHIAATASQQQTIEGVQIKAQIPGNCYTTLHNMHKNEKLIQYKFTLPPPITSHFCSVAFTNNISSWLFQESQPHKYDTLAIFQNTPQNLFIPEICVYSVNGIVSIQTSNGWWNFNRISVM